MKPSEFSLNLSLKILVQEVSVTHSGTEND